MVKVNDILRLTKGVGGSHTKWQRKPPAHAVYQVKLNNNKTTIVKVYAENRALDEEDHPTIQKMEETDHMALDGHDMWNSLSKEEQNTVKEAISDRVKDAEFFEKN